MHLAESLIEFLTCTVILSETCKQLLIKLLFSKLYSSPQLADSPLVFFLISSVVLRRQQKPHNVWENSAKLGCWRTNEQNASGLSAGCHCLPVPDVCTFEVFVTSCASGNYTVRKLTPNSVSGLIQPLSGFTKVNMLALKSSKQKIKNFLSLDMPAN